MREHVHQQVGVGQSLELAAYFIGGGTRVVCLFCRSSLPIRMAEWTAQALTGIEQLAIGHLSHSTSIAALLLPDVLHGSTPMG